MTPPSSDSFQRALARFKKSTATRSPDLLSQFQNSNLEDLRAVCDGIQTDMGKTGHLRSMNRLRGFIEAMEQLGQTIEVFVNASEFVCFVWGPMKFLLGIAKAHVDCFDKLLDAYEKVGAMIPGLLAYRAMLEKHPPLRTVLEDYYSDILHFHEAALKVFLRPMWKKAFKSLWKTFDTELQPLMQSLSNRRELLESEKGSASLYEISKAREEMTVRYEETKRKLEQDELQKHKSRLIQIKDRLKAADYQQDQEMAFETRIGTNSGDWILDVPGFDHWAGKLTTGHHVLYVHGMPGAGKTTLTSSIVARLLNQTDRNINPDCNTLVAYFYFKRKQSNKDTHQGLLRALIEQIVFRDAVLSDQLFDELSSVEGPQVRLPKYLQSLFAKSLESYERCFVVIDGLDEVAPDEARKSLDWLLSLTKGAIKEPTISLRVLCSGQRDGLLDSLLAKYPAISLDTSPEHHEDVRKYCNHQSARIQDKFELSPEMQQEIASQVCKHAKSMFLYAKVVLDNLLGQVTLGRLEKELQPDTFPKGIEQAYERVAVRILGKDRSAGEREFASTIIGWVTCAPRPLHWREIESTFCIDVDASTVNYDKSRPRGSCKKIVSSLVCKEFCGSLVDVHQANSGQFGPDDLVTVVHETARVYLREVWINPTLENAKCAIWCFRYLTSKPFHLETTPDEIMDYAKRGYYGLHDYAVQHYMGHFERSTSAGFENATLENASALEALTESARTFIEMHSLTKPQSSGLLSYYDIIKFFGNLPQNHKERASGFNTGYRTTNIRKQLELLRQQTLTDEDMKSINNLYGFQIKYKCPRAWCDYFYIGFEKESERTAHNYCHERPFRCVEDNCFGSEFGFDTSEKLKNHRAQYHELATDIIRFPRADRKFKDLPNAAAQGDTVAITSFLSEVPHLKDKDGMGPIYRAGKYDPVFRAAQKGHYQACRLLLDNRFRLYERTMEIAMSLERRSDLVHLFLTIQAPQRFAITPIQVMKYIGQACSQGDLDTVKVLFETPQIQSEVTSACASMLNTQVWMRNACRSGATAIAEYLLNKGLSTSVTSFAVADARLKGKDDLANLLSLIIHMPLLDENQNKYASLIGLEGAWRLAGEKEERLFY